MKKILTSTIPALQRRFWSRDSKNVAASYSGTMIPTSLGAHSCNFLNNEMTILSDGNVTCGLDDAHATRSFGNVKNSSVREIWNSKEYELVRDNLSRGILCSTCKIYQKVTAEQPAFPVSSGLPVGLIIEPSILCNIRCGNETCNILNNAKTTSRDSHTLSFDDFCRIIDETAHSLATLHLYHYGEPFMNRDTEKMIAYARKANPDLYIATSTNGIPLANPARAKDLVESGLNHITFTIGGADQSTYEKYHKRGSFEKAIMGMKNVCDEKKRTGSSHPIVLWRYLTFYWNDSEEQIIRAKSIARELDVDRLSFFLTRIPEGSESKRLAPGTPAAEELKEHLDYEFSYFDSTYGIPVY